MVLFMTIAVRTSNPTHNEDVREALGITDVNTASTTSQQHEQGTTRFP
jgi:hypothetical protein